ncbi:glycosyltransferase [Aquimarina sp. SS2-1]|uniref:glycosyltransferase n=1 Tax=Aquimarina besae TaxID=3342247 RepID=UPI00366C28CC
MTESIIKTYIVILNYKSWKDTIECLESVLKTDHPNFQIILVDNSPTSESLDQITSWANGDDFNVETSFPELVYPLESKPINYVLIEEKNLEPNSFEDKKLLLVKAKENKGFSAGNNVALKYINRVADEQDKIWLLNNDTVVPKNTLFKLLETINNKTNTGIVGARLLEYEKPELIQSIGGKYNHWIGKITILQNGEDANKVFDKEVSFDYPIGASLFLNLNFIRKVGLMEERYFLYFEEYDWVLRGNKRGFKSVFSSEAIVYHKGGGSSGGGTSKMADFYGIRSKILFTKKFYPYKLPILFLSFIFFVLNRIKRKQFDRIPMVFKLMRDPNLKYYETDHK